MDDMVYDYHTINNEKSNRLNYVTDNVSDYSGYDDIKQGQVNGNYSYNRIGELTGDFQEEMELVWRYGDHKLEEVIRHDDDSPNIEYVYDPLGTRVAKIVKPRQNGQLSPQYDWEVHYYVYNGQGQLMATYESKLYEQDGETVLTEQFIYGVERHGHIKQNKEVYNDGAITPSTAPLVENTLGKRRYELKSYNDNVHVVITDRKVYNSSEDAFEAVDVQKSDYYAFGMSMPGRSIYNEPIRYGYHGQEMDSEHKGDGNHYTTYFRQYDPRLGRWMSLDPESAMFPFESNYAANHNNPIIYVDSEGDSPLLVSFAIGVGTDVVMQFVKGLFSEIDGKRFNFEYAFQNIDIGDAVINGFVQMLLPGLGVFSEGIDKVLKYRLKRLVKYSGKLLMTAIDFRINFKNLEDRRIKFLGINWSFEIELDFQMVFLDSKEGFGKSFKYWFKDFRVQLIGVAFTELDIFTGIFSGIWEKSGQQWKLPEFGGKFSKYYLSNQMGSNLFQQIFEGILKGFSIKKDRRKMMSVNIKNIDKKIDAIDQLPEVIDIVKGGGGLSSDTEDDNPELDIESVKEQGEKGGMLERND